MATATTGSAQTKTSPQQFLPFRSHVYTMIAAFAGVVFGVLGSLGFISNYMQSQFAAQTAAIDKRLVSFSPSSTYAGACVAPSTMAGGYGSGGVSGSGHAAVMPSSTTPSTGGKGAGGGSGGDGHVPTNPQQPKPSKPFVSQLISANISNTGPRSTNTVNASNSYTSTVTNNNTVDVENDNDQAAFSGDATSTGNTTAGAASTGDAHNENSTETMITIKN